MAGNQVLTLLSNASATGSPQFWPGGDGVFDIEGTLGGATVTLERLGPDGTTWRAVSSATTVTALGPVGFSWPPGLLRASVSGGSPSGLFASIAELGG